VYIFLLIYFDLTFECFIHANDDPQNAINIFTHLNDFTTLEKTQNEKS